MGSFYDLLLASKLSGGGGGGGGGSLEDAILDGTFTGVYENTRITALRQAAFNGAAPGFTGFSFPNVVSIGANALYQQTGAESINLPKCETIGNFALAYCSNANLKTMVLKSAKTFGIQSMRNMNGLETLDILGSSTSGAIAANIWVGNSKMNKLIIRFTGGVVPLANTNAFDSTPFWSNGTGGEIYIHKSLYDHLGDGTANDYKAASNWSTINGYGTITWKAIEGSYYETHYADGTPISA